MRRLAVVMGLALQLSALITCSVLGSLLLGLWLDRQLRSAPCLMMLFMVVGLVLAVTGVHRLTKKVSH